MRVEARVAIDPPLWRRLVSFSPASGQPKGRAVFSMADHLLSILRGTAPAPAAPPRSPHHDEATSTPSPSLSRHDSASQGQPASSASNGLNEGRDSTAPPRNPLEQLLRTFSQPRPTPSSPAPSPLPTGDREADTGQVPTTTSKDSATLLSLLKGSSSSSGPVPTSPSTKPAVTTSPLLSPRGGNAKDLLGLLMGGSASTSPAAREQPPAAPSSSSSLEEPLAATTRAQAPEGGTTDETKEAPQTGQTLGLTGMPEEAVAPAEANATSSSSATAAPVFTFVSPFDFLDSIRSPPPATTAKRTDDGQQQRDAAVPQSLPTATESGDAAAAAASTARRSFAASAPVAFVSAAASVPSAPSPTSIISASEVGAQSNATTPPNGGGGGGAGSTFPHEYLASGYLSPAPAPAPSWAPLGVRLPRRASLPPNAPQHLTISTSDPHHEALVPSPPEVTPIALFSVPAEDRRSLARRRTAGIWEHGIAYASAAGSGKHRIRVIDRESGAKVLLKGKRDEKEVVDLQVDRSSRDGYRRIACVANGGALSVWQVPDRFENENEASKQCVCACPPFENCRRDSLVLICVHHFDRSTRILHIAGEASPSPFVFARFVPGQQRLYVVRADRVISVYYLSQPAAKPRDIRLIGGGEIVDVAFSPDAAYAAVLMTKSVVTFQLDNSGAQKKLELDEILPSGVEADQVAFVTPAAEATTPQDPPRRRQPLGLAISSAHGTRISVIPTQSQEDGRLSLATTPTAEIEMTPPPSSEHADSLFGQMEYHEKTQSLVMSHSLRGSLFTFRLAFVDGPADGGGEQPLIRVNHVLEHPTPAPVLSFTLDSLPAADPHAAAASSETDLPEGVRAASKIRYGALVVHPGGVHHVALIAEQPRQYAAAAAEEVAPKDPSLSHDSDTSSDGEGPFARRMSLEGSIHVSSEVEVTVEEIQVVELEVDEVVIQTVLLAASVDEPDDDDLEQSPTTAEGTPRGSTTAMPAAASSPPPPSRRLAAEPALGDLSNGLPAASTPVAELSSAEAASSSGPGLADVKLSGPLVNAAIRNMKATRSGSPAAANATPLGPAPTAATQRSGPSESARFEQALPAKIAQIVQQELQKKGES